MFLSSLVLIFLMLLLILHVMLAETNMATFSNTFYHSPLRSDASYSVQLTLSSAMLDGHDGSPVHLGISSWVK